MKILERVRKRFEELGQRGLEWVGSGIDFEARLSFWGGDKDWITLKW